MKILMMTSPEPIKNKSGFSLIEKRFPLGIGFLIAVLRQNGHEVDFIDQYLKRDFSFNPNDYGFIGIYANTPCEDGFLDLVKYIENSLQWPAKVKIAVGGPHASMFPERIPGSVNYIVQGEGEEIICDLVEGKYPEGIIETNRIRDLDKIPLPDYEMFEGDYIIDVKWFNEKPVFNMNTSRGCPFSCAFCSVKKIWGRIYTYMSAEKVINDIKILIAESGIKGVYFREDNFTLIKKRVVGICKGIRPLGLKWCCETRVDTLDEELVKIMAESGCEAFYIGFESGSQKLLDIFNKSITIEQGIRVAEWSHKYGIKIAASLIKKHPMETPEDIKLTEAFIAKIKPETVWSNTYREDG